MRFFSVIAFMAYAASSAWLANEHCQAAEQFPYTAYVNSNDVYIRSGPGKNYYPTEKLAKGEAVEIYRHDPGGWYAIRPTQGSFDWVPADCLKPHGDRLATVEKDKSLCFVGTRFSNAHDVHQLRLDKGEKVEILDVKQIGEGADAKSWCQIAPPSGEFRWVFGKFVDRDPPSGLSTKSNGDRASRRSDAFDEQKPPRHSSDADEHTTQRSDWTAKSASASTSSSRDSSWGSKDKKPVTAVGTPTASTDPFQTELDSIDIELSKMASDDPSTWECTALRRRAENSLNRADTALERGKVRLILNRIARMEDVKRRNDLLSQPGNAGMIAAARPSVLPVDQPNQYDGIGKLMPVVSYAQRPNTPKFALVDGSNQVVSFITPAPGVNLQPYVGKEVGISGQRGFMPELQKPHVTAMRVNVIDGTTLR